VAKIPPSQIDPHPNFGWMTHPGVWTDTSMHSGQRGDAGTGLFGGVRASRHCTQVGGVVGCGLILPCAVGVREPLYTGGQTNSRTVSFFFPFFPFLFFFSSGKFGKQSLRFRELSFMSFLPSFLSSHNISGPRDTFKINSFFSPCLL
jgi:hypothetical protein